MFTRQSSQIGVALHQGGVDAALARQVESLLGQCRERIEHRGPIDFNYTPPRAITPALGSHSLPRMRPFRPFEFPKKQKKQPAPPEQALTPPEHKRDARQPNNEGPGDGPDGENVNDAQDYEGGAFIDVNNQEHAIRLKTSNTSKRHCTFPMSPGGAIGFINGVSFVAESNHSDYLSLQIKERNSDTLFSVTADIAEIEVITGVSIVDGQLLFTKKSCWVFNPQVISPTAIDITECPAP